MWSLLTNYYFTKIQDPKSFCLMAHQSVLCVTATASLDLLRALKILQELELWDILHLKRHLLLCDLAEEASC